MLPTIGNLPREQYDRFRVEAWADWLGGFVARRASFWEYLGNLETRRLGGELEEIEIRTPIFVCGLARSGTTVLLECLAEHEDTVTHRYRDYPGVLAPVLWDRFSKRLYGRNATAVERAHGDGIAVTPDSPEAIEEMLWMAFHPDGHDPAYDNRVRRGGVASRFAAFYRDHIRKLLWLREGGRYLSKGNYNLARLEGLIELFPDARFVVPVRDPVTHIASLVRQHALFSAAEAVHPAALRYMQRVGHFEFGLDRRPINFGNNETTAQVQQLWTEGSEVEGWSLYWADVHGFVANLRDREPELRRAMLLVRFEELCTEPARVLKRLFTHVDLAVSDDFIATLSHNIRAPAYYSLPFDDEEQHTIRRLTAAVAGRLGYRDGF